METGILIGVGIFVFLLILSSIKIIDQYERGVILTLGVYSYTLSPGLRLIVPIIQRMRGGIYLL